MVTRGNRSSLILLAVCLCASAVAAEVFTPDHVAKIRGASSAVMSPDGKHVAYTLRVQREPYEQDSGGAWSELHVVDRAGNSRPFITGEVSIGSVDWTPDGLGISFLAKRGEDKHRCLYVIPIDGGEAQNVLAHETGISEYSWCGDGKRVAFTAREKEDKDKKKLKDKGFNAQVYEEGLEPVRVWIADVSDEDDEPRMLDMKGSAYSIEWSPVGDRLVVALAPTPLIDDRYMRRKIHVVDVANGETVTRFDNIGKLGAIRWSPNGQQIAFISGEDIHDPSAGRLMIGELAGGEIVDLIPGYPGHIMTIEWMDSETVAFIGHEGTQSVFGRKKASGGGEKRIVAGGPVVLRSLSLSSSGKDAAFLADGPAHPTEVFAMTHGEDAPTRLTDSNPWMADLRMAPQEVVQYPARDGLEIEGILVRPLDEEKGKRYPLIMAVHGGPEAHISNGWTTRYSYPGQVGAARGFAVFYPNYRGSTGRGVAFSKLGQADYAGAEFDDLVDAVDHLVNMGLVDRKKVGVTGGSYGGFATAWASTKLTEHFAAGVMFVGISNHISKAGTTDIPTEMYLVHSRKWPWEDWDFFRERSPLTYVEQANTPLLIIHGKEDTRVHPSQSMELYRYLKILGKVPVRLIFYPGEGHGNRKSAGRYDYNLRMIRWFEHYLLGPGGDPPPHDVDYPFDDDKNEDGSNDDGES